MLQWINRVKSTVVLVLTIAWFTKLSSRVIYKNGKFVKPMLCVFNSPWCKRLPSCVTLDRLCISDVFFCSLYTYIHVYTHGIVSSWGTYAVSLMSMASDKPRKMNDQGQTSDVFLMLCLAITVKSSTGVILSFIRLIIIAVIQKMYWIRNSQRDYTKILICLVFFL